MGAALKGSRESKHWCWTTKYVVVFLSMTRIGMRSCNGPALGWMAVVDHIIKKGHHKISVALSSAILQQACGAPHTLHLAGTAPPVTTATLGIDVDTS